MFKFTLKVTERKIENLEERVNDIKEFLSSKGGVYDELNPDLVIVVGGDGTLLQALRAYSNYLTSFLVIGAGKLGFYKEYDISDLTSFYNEFDFDKLIREEHHLLELYDSNANKAYAANEFLIASSIRTLDLEIAINSKYFMSTRCSGICIASPFGSTAYNCSLGGSIVTGDKGMICNLLAPISNRLTRPTIKSLVLKDEDSITIQITNDANFELAADMRDVSNLQGKVFTIKKSKRSFNLAHTKECDEYQRIKRAFEQKK